MNTSKPRGFFSRLLVLDVETTGIAFNSVDPSYNSSTGELYQCVSVGLIVADASTLAVLDTLYVEIQWNGTSKWQIEAERVHGLSKKYLEESGVSEEEACLQIAELIIKHWGPEGIVCLSGHNVATFDKFFIDRLMKAHNIPIKWGSRVVDTNSIGFATFGTYNSDDLFAEVGLPDRDPTKHNALVDAYNALESIKRVRQLFSLVLND